MDFICTYLCPIRSERVDPQIMEDLYTYWEKLNRLGCEVLVVDGSPPHIFKLHQEYWDNCRHIKVDSRYRFLNGKVNGLITGVLEASHDFIIMGDDDIKYDSQDIHRMVEGLQNYQMVRPQNYFDPLPFWTQIDTGRILLNRAFLPEGDFPGTLGFRKETFLSAWPYDGDVLFDNEEIVKHFENRGAKILYARDFFIRRLPPSFEKWLEQRPRQAYEDFIMKKRTAFSLAVLPAVLLPSIFKKPKMTGLVAGLIAAGCILKAQKGRTGSAKEYFAGNSLLFAPLWVLERSISVYLALYWKITKGGYPFGDKVIRKGTGKAWTEGKQQPYLQRTLGN